MKMYAYQAWTTVQSGERAQIAGTYSFTSRAEGAGKHRGRQGNGGFLSECVGAKGFESGGYFEIAAFAMLRLFRAWRAALRINLGLTAQLTPGCISVISGGSHSSAQIALLARRNRGVPKITYLDVPPPRADITGGIPIATGFLDALSAARLQSLTCTRSRSRQAVISAYAIFRVRNLASLSA